MSTCIDQNYNAASLYHNGDKILETTPNGIKVNIGTSAKPIEVMYISSPPHNPVAGSMYFDTSLQELRVYDGQNWQTVDGSILDQKMIDQFDILVNDIGFLKVKLYQEVPSGVRGVLIFDGEELFIEDTKEAIDFIRDNITDGYLWVEKRILEHLG